MVVSGFVQICCEFAEKAGQRPVARGSGHVMEASKLAGGQAKFT